MLHSRIFRRIIDAEGVLVKSSANRRVEIGKLRLRATPRLAFRLAKDVVTGLLVVCPTASVVHLQTKPWAVLDPVGEFHLV